MCDPSLEAADPAIRGPEVQSDLPTGESALVRDDVELREQLAQARRQIRELASALTQVEQRERRKLAASLHDELAQLLILSKMKLSAIRPINAAETIRAVLETQQFLDEAIRFTRQKMADLAPAHLHETGIVAALESLASRVQQSHDLRVTFHDDGRPKPLPEDVRSLVFNCARELLTNTLKHAKTCETTIELALEGRLLRMCVRDQGVGFDPQRALDRGTTHEGGFGLLNLRDRVQMFNGELDVQSAPGRGTTITLTVPLEPMAMQ